MKKIICKFIASFYMELRDFYNKDGMFYNPIKAINYDLRMHKWLGKIK